MALSWHLWTPLKRCGCQSGNMKKTDHVPSTGRPSRRSHCPTTSPRTVFKTPPSYCQRILFLSYLGTSASSINLISLSTSCFMSSRETFTRLCVTVSLFSSLFCYSCPPSHAAPALGWQHSPVRVQTLTHRGPSGCFAKAAISTVDSSRPCYFKLLHIKVLILLSFQQKPCKV